MLFAVARTSFAFAASAQVDAFRGALGAALHARGPEVYARWFDPRWTDGPSGYRDAPRPFVLRRTESGLDLISFRKDESGSEMPAAVDAAIRTVTGGHSVRGCTVARLQLPTEGAEKDGVLRLNFVTPIELKSAGVVLERPEFFALMERLTERVWALGRMYQEWPEEFSFGDLLHAARYVKTLNWQWTRTDFKRRSARSGKVHAVGGFIGWAEYAGSLGRFLPLLEIGRWTGVGRQTVWGNGEIRIDGFAARE